VKPVATNLLERRDVARLWRADDFGGLELLRASYVSFVFTPHAHEEFLIALTEEGAGYPIFRRDSHPVGPGDVFILNPEESHAGGPAGDTSWGYRAIYPSRAVLLRIAEEFDGARTIFPDLASDIVRDPDVAARLWRFHLMSERPEATRLQREMCLAEALVALLSAHAGSSRALRPLGKEPGAVRIARQYLDENFTDNVPLVDLAVIAGLSPFHLCRVFKAAVGLTPHAYVSQLRVRRAKQLLSTGLPIAEVAVDAGFYDQAHLSRHFKRVVGLPPGQYAAACRN
jgi:AraC-like DNA-binding protein